MYRLFLATILNNDFEQMGIDIYHAGDSSWYSWQNLTLTGSGGGLSRRSVVTGNHFSSWNSEAIDLTGNNASILFEGNTYSYVGATPRRVYVLAATNGANAGITVTNETVDACASPCINVASGAMSNSGDFAQLFCLLHLRSGDRNRWGARGELCCLGQSRCLRTGKYCSADD